MQVHYAHNKQPQQPCKHSIQQGRLTGVEILGVHGLPGVNFNVKIPGNGRKRT